MRFAPRARQTGARQRTRRSRHAASGAGTQPGRPRQPHEGPLPGTQRGTTMRYVIIRDDDTNALTPVECLERLYRPLLHRGLPVNLATIPNVATDTTMTDGRLEGYLFPAREEKFTRHLAAETVTPRLAEVMAAAVAVGHHGSGVPDLTPDLPSPSIPATLPMRSNQKLIRYLLENPGYHIL